MDIRELKLRDYVFITTEDSNWNGLYGIVHEINKDEGTVDIFCLQNPSYTYKVGIWNANTIEKVDINKLGVRGYEQVV